MKIIELCYLPDGLNFTINGYPTVIKKICNQVNGLVRCAIENEVFELKTYQKVTPAPTKYTTTKDYTHLEIGRK